MTFLGILALLAKASVLLSVAAALSLMLRRSSAALRHAVYATAIIGLLALPLLSAVLPPWAAVSIPPPVASATVTSAPSLFEATTAPPATLLPDSPATSSTPARAAFNWAAAALWSYGGIGLLLLLRLVAQRAAIGRVARRATRVTDETWLALVDRCRARIGVHGPVRVLRSVQETMPMTFGTWRPAIVLPSTADLWAAERREAVLLHELAHVARRDCLMQMLAAIACCVYWIHPGVWWLARRMRIERELACDDRVLAAGTPGREYADHLLELAYSLRSDLAPALAVSMASSRQLEGRLLAVVDGTRRRGLPAGRWLLSAIAAGVVGLLAIASAAATSAQVSPSNRQTPERATAAPQTVTAGTDGAIGTWEIRPAANGLVHVQLREGDGFYGTSYEVATLSLMTGLTPAQVTGTGTVRFSIRRDAGTFTFEGVTKNGTGAGTYSFTPNRAFADELAQRGYARPSDAQLRILAVSDVGIVFLNELNTQRYSRPSLNQLIRLAEHGVSLSYLRDLGALGYRLGNTEELIAMRDHGVGPEYIRGLAGEGLPRLSTSDLYRSRDHGLSPEYIRALKGFGFKELTLDTLIDARDHGVSVEYVRDMRELGYMLSLDDTKRARDHGVGPEYIRDLRALGYPWTPLDGLIRLREHGVGPEFIREFNALGYTRLNADELIALRDHGIGSEQTRKANARAGRQLTIPDLTRLADRGWRP